MTSSVGAALVGGGRAAETSSEAVVAGTWLQTVSVGAQFALLGVEPGRNGYLEANTPVEIIFLSDEFNF